MRIPQAFAIKSILVSAIAGAILSGPVMALSVATTPTAVPVASARASTPNMYYR